MRIRLPVIGCLLLSAICLSSIASAQTNWARTYGGSDNEEGYSVEKTTDGGYIIAGYTNSFGAGWHDVYLIKTNTSGDTLWTRTYGGRYHDEGHSARQTADGGYIIAGSIDCPSPTHSYLVKTDARGDTLWTRVFGGPIYYNGMGYSALQTPDGGYVMAGTFGGWSIYLQKTDARGDHLWNMMYAGDVGYSVQQTADSGFVIAGRSGGHFCLLRTKADGATLWTKTYRGTDWGDGYFARQTADGGFMVTGHVTPSDSVNADVYLIKTNALGDTLWTRTYGGTYFDRGCSVLQTADGGYIITGTTASFGAGNGDVYLIRTDDQGDTLWTRTYGGSGSDECYSVQPVIDGNYVIAGHTGSFGADDSDVYLIKTRGLLDVGPTTILSPSGTALHGSVYVPRVVVRNFGMTSGLLSVTMNIGSGYSQMIQETLVSLPLDTLVFPPWTADPVGSTSITCFTSLAGDENPTNDTIRDSVRVLRVNDVAATAILSPPGIAESGSTNGPGSSPIITGVWVG